MRDLTRYQKVGLIRTDAIPIPRDTRADYWWIHLALLLVALVGGCAQPVSRKTLDDSNTPVSFDSPRELRDMLLLLPLRFRGTDYWFLLDTGTTGIIFDSRFKAQLGSPVGSSPWNGIGRRMIPNEKKLPLYPPVDASIGPFNIRSAGPVGCADLSAFCVATGQDIAGIVGMRFLEQFVVQVDLDRSRATLSMPDERDHPEWGIQVALEPNSRGQPTVEADLSGVGRVAMVVDTGFASLNQQAGYLPYAIIARVPMPATMSLGTFGADHLTFAELGDAGGLGAGFLSRFIVTFDFPHRRLFLLPRHVPIDPPAWYIAGLLFRRDGNRYVVTAVSPGGPADKAMIEPGDVLLAINRQGIDQLPIWSVAKRLISERAMLVTLSLQRDGHRFDAAITLSHPGNK